MIVVDVIRSSKYFGNGSEDICRWLVECNLKKKKKERKNQEGSQHFALSIQMNGVRLTEIWRVVKANGRAKILKKIMGVMLDNIHMYED